MGGGLLQIAAYGAQDVYLTGDPQITFFKVVYRRHTNFSMEAIAQQFSGTVNFGKKRYFLYHLQKRRSRQLHVPSGHSTSTTNRRQMDRLRRTPPYQKRSRQLRRRHHRRTQRTLASRLGSTHAHKTRQGLLRRNGGTQRCRDCGLD